MIPLPGTGIDPEELTENDEELRSLLKRYAYVPAASDSTLPDWMRGEGWGLRGAVGACIMFLVLGFVAGRNSDNQTLNETLLALAYATPLQLFVMAPSLLGDDDVITE